MSHDRKDAQASTSAPTGEALVVHTRARQLLEWLLPALARFPREHRHTVTRHMAERAMLLHDALIAARHDKGPARAAALREADLRLDQLRQYGLLAHQWRWWSDGQYEHFSRLCEETGRLLGGWRRAVAAQMKAREEAD